MENIQVGAGHLGIFTDIFLSICGTILLGIPARQLNTGQMCFSVQVSSIKMVNVDEVRAYLSSLNTMDIIWLGNRLGDHKAKLKEFQPLENDVCHTVVFGNVATVVGHKWLIDQMCSKCEKHCFSQDLWKISELRNFEKFLNFGKFTEICFCPNLFLFIEYFF